MSSSGRVCVDASFVVRLVVAGPLGEAASRVWQSWRREGLAVMAPSLLLFEATNALHRYVAAGILESEEAREALEVILDLGIAFDADPLLHAKALQVAAHFRLPAAYDAHYLALAQANSAELWTADMRLARAVSAELAWVKLLSAEAPEAGP